MSNKQSDLDLLLSLQDRVLETPPASPSTHFPGYLSDDGSPRRVRRADMSVFQDVVQDCLDSDVNVVKNAFKSNQNKSSKDADVKKFSGLRVNLPVFRDAVQDTLGYDSEAAKNALKSNRAKSSNEADVEKFSGLRIRNQLVSATELSNHFSDIRFIRLPAIKNLLKGDTLSGCWVTVGVLCEKGNPKTSSTGKTYCIWKIGCLDEETISVFLFGDAYQGNCNEKAGTIFALFNCGVRKDAQGRGFSLNVFSAARILKMGTSVDFGVCKGKTKDGMACTLAINKRQGIYCKYHKLKTSGKYSTSRAELMGGNLKTGFRDPLRSEGIHLVDPLADRTRLKKSNPPVKLLSLDGLKKALSNAGKVTTNASSQGIRFLNEIAGYKNNASPMPKNLSSSAKRSSSLPSEVGANELVNTKRIKTGQGHASKEKTSEVKEKMIELDLISSDEEI